MTCLAPRLFRCQRGCGSPTFDAAQPGPVKVQCTGVAVCRFTTEIHGNSAGEPPIDSDMTLAEQQQQQQDAEIGPIVRKRLQQEQPPSSEELLAESEAAKVLHAAVVSTEGTKRFGL